MSSRAKQPVAKKRPTTPEPTPEPTPAGNTYASFFDEPCAEPMRKSKAARAGVTPQAKITGIVVDRREFSVDQGGRKVAKVGLDLIVTSVDATGTDDVVVGAGVLGDAYVLPTRKVDTPESAEKDSKMPPVRTLVVDAMSTTRRLSNVSLGLYKDGLGGADAGLAQIGVGSLVEVDRLCVNEVVTKGNKVSYLNSGKATPLMSDAPGPGALAPHLIATLQRPELLRYGAFSASIPCKGYFNYSGLSAPQQVQAAACQAMFAKVVTSTADRLLGLAGSKEGPIADAFAAHEARVRATTPEELASGEKNLFITHEKDSAVAPWLSLGVKPWDRRPELFRRLVEGGEAAAALPDCFFVPSQVQAQINGNGVSIECRALFVFEKASALAALEQGCKAPWLTSDTAVLSFNYSLKEMALKFGSTLKAKLDVAVTQIIPFADFAAFVKVSQVEGGGSGLNSQWAAGGPFFDMPATLEKTGIRVSEAFVKKELAEGNSQFVADADTSSERYELPNGKSDFPTFALHRFQELTYASPSGVGGFKFAALKPLEGKSKAFCVVFDGSVADLAANKELASDTETGEAHIAAKAKEEGLEVKDLLTGSCLVYAFMV